MSPLTKRRASITFIGVFTHEQYRTLCAALDQVGQVYSSMCTEEREKTLVLISLFTDMSTEKLQLIVRSVITNIEEVTIDCQEEAHAEKCN